MARWTRAIAALPPKKGRILGLGCAFGFATRMLKRAGYSTVGVDTSSRYIEQARQADLTGEYFVADAAHTPLAAASFDGAICLDVLEHLPDEPGAATELARLVRPGGTLVLSVPYRGPLARLDSLNLYAALVRRTHHGRFPPEIATTGVHRQYSRARIQQLLGAEFEIQRYRRTGLGLAELINLPLLVLFRWLLPFERAYQMTAFAYYTTYLAEDLLPLGPFSYHLIVVAVRRGDPS